MACEGCIDPHREFNLALPSYYATARKEAEETHSPIAICRNYPGWELFTIDAREARQRNLFIVDVISGLPLADAK